MQESTETMRTELEERLRFETLLAEISSRFVIVPADQIDGEIEDAQRRICELLNLDRATLWQLSEKEPRMLLTHAHHTQGASRFSKETNGKELFPWVRQKIRAGETVIVSKLTDFPPEAGRDLESCRLYGTKSAVIIPVSIGKEPVFAALTFAVVREERDWPKTVVKGLQLIAQVFANALARKQTEKALRESEARRDRAKEALEQSERKLRLLSSHLLSADETERKRISKELHDQLGQDLVGLKLHVGSIQRELSEGKAAVHGEFESVKGDIDRIIENVRRLSRELGPYALEHLGLWQALRYLTEELTKHYRVTTSFDILSGDNVLPQSTQLNIFRVFQEAFTNIRKHADAAHVSIEVGERDGHLSFVIEDDGRGFDVSRVMEESPAEKGLGLVIMEERIRILGGVFDIWSQKGTGTRISFTVPVDRERRQE